MTRLDQIELNKAVDQYLRHDDNCNVVIASRSFGITCNCGASAAYDRLKIVLAAYSKLTGLKI